MALLDRLPGRGVPDPPPRLDGRTTVVCGGAGEVGEGIVAGLLDAGARVAVPSRGHERLQALEHRLRDAGRPVERLVPVIGDLSAGEDAAQALAADVLRLAGPPDLVVAALGGWAAGPPLAELGLDEWESAIHDGLRAHHLAVRAFVPLLRDRPGAGYAMINGAAARYPVPGSGAVSTVAAGELMAAQVLAAEESGYGVQVEAYVLGPVATRSRSESAPWMASAEQVGGVIADRAGRRLAGGGDAGPATVVEILTAGDLRRARDLPPGGVRGAGAGRAGWILWGLQTGNLSNQVRRGAPPRD
ncbi:SDR family NAD(P)-dependent oxidoreductase [Patulibacter brassicae]|jgi:3-oxoacyl-[acyl-carrier protein] reductase|uniref:SDR family NAD(P)-dependent oxidoreductase n=1 Tax=Patulibacter brassicae TaxID=1705717 RepID=A0ABU4VJA8_9ACTN|nr:SDR family NAD(P)-dependent oxidoreductase [Patulibacter brassicae]MDX8151929.1 SDR family NAD(P)-dependent oxidoreductase [Patulibacter brassicae]